MKTMMQGFPPTPVGQVTLANWRTSPYSRWAFHHVRELIPTAEIAHDPTSVRALASAPRSLAAVKLADASGRTITHTEFLLASDTDGLVILHRGRIIAEQYANGMTGHSPHILMSVSKSMLGLLAGVRAVQKELRPERPVNDLVPEVGNGSYAGISIRNLLDMRAGIIYDENYAETAGPIVEYRKAMGWNPVEQGDRPADVRSFLATLNEPSQPHGGPTNYVSPGTDLLGWA